MTATDKLKQGNEDEMVAILLKDVPEIATVRRENLEKIIRSAFNGGWRMATLYREYSPEEIVQ